MLPQAATRTELSRRPAQSHVASPTVQALDGKRGSLAQSMQLMGATMSFARNSEIFGENEPADYVYCVVSGSVRTYKILNDGRRQVGGFYLSGDIFGLEFVDAHTFSAEAIAELEGVGREAQRADRACRPRRCHRPRAVCAHRPRAAARAGPRAISGQKRAGASRGLPPGDGRARMRRKYRGIADVAPGHRRLSGPDDRNRVADIDRPGKRRGHRGAGLAPYRAAQPFDTQPTEQLNRVRPGRSCTCRRTNDAVCVRLSALLLPIAPAGFARGGNRARTTLRLGRKQTMGIAITLAQYLVDDDIAYDLVPHPHTETASASAAASQVPADSVAKAVVLKGRDGFMLAVLPASRHIQFDELQRLLGGDVDMANEEQIETLFLDCEPGSVPALGAAYGLNVVVDDSLAQQPDVYFEGGDHANLVHVSGTSFQKLMADSKRGRFTGRA